MAKFVSHSKLQEKGTDEKVAKGKELYYASVLFMIKPVFLPEYGNNKQLHIF